jgi:hypothetical protein
LLPHRVLVDRRDVDVREQTSVVVAVVALSALLDVPPQLRERRVGPGVAHLAVAILVGTGRVEVFSVLVRTALLVTVVGRARCLSHSRRPP